MNRRHFLLAVLGLATCVATVGTTRAGEMEDVPLVGTWYVFDYSKEPVDNWDLEILAVKGDGLVIQVSGSKGEAQYDAEKRCIDFKYGDRHYVADIQRNDKGIWIMKGISKTSLAQETSTFTAILQKR